MAHGTLARAITNDSYVSGATLRNNREMNFPLTGDRNRKICRSYIYFNEAEREGGFRWAMMVKAFSHQGHRSFSPAEIRLTFLSWTHEHRIIVRIPFFLLDFLIRYPPVSTFTR